MTFSSETRHLQDFSFINNFYFCHFKLISLKIIIVFLYKQIITYLIEVVKKRMGEEEGAKKKCGLKTKTNFLCKKEPRSIQETKRK